LAKKYSDEGADEIVFLDISATNEKRKTAADLAKKVAQNISIPFTIGGGVSDLKTARDLLKSGADKIAINSAAVKNPNLISEISKNFGAQAVIVAIDAKKVSDKKWEIFTHGGKISAKIDAVFWAKKVEKWGAGEILLTSIDRDGTKKGFDISLTAAISDAVKIPVIASGGAKTAEHFAEVFQKTTATGALAASIFHFSEMKIPDLKKFLISKKIPIRAEI